MKYIVTLNGKKYEVEVERGQATAVYAGDVTTAPTPAPMTPTPTTPTPVNGNEQPITAPMPGTILDIRCQPGQVVKSGDILFILEAMKMENEICASRDGTISTICATKGGTVETGATLCTLI